MKTKKENINLKELFRQKLEYAEVIPDAAVKSKLMHRVALKEFLRFNPVRLNIFYLGGILITGLTAAVILFSGQGNTQDLNRTNTVVNLVKSDTSHYFVVKVEQPVRIEPDKSNITKNKSDNTSRETQIPVKSVTEYSKPAESHKAILSMPASISRTLTNNNLFTGVKVDKNKLQEEFNTDESLIEPNNSAGCAPLKIKFHNNSTLFDSCRWTFGDGGYSNSKDPEWIFDVEGEYKVVLQVFGPNGRYLSSTASVTVHPRPRAHFEITPGKAVLPDDEIRFLNYSTNAVQFRWDFGDGSASEFFEPTHTYKNYSTYNVRLVVFSEWGCSDSMTVINAFSGSEYFIDFPNAFIPNVQGPTGGYYSTKSDENAQVFHPSYSGVSDYQLKIFSKLGIQIFESNDVNLGWDGYNNGQLCESGVYIWKVRVNSETANLLLKWEM